MDLSLAGITIRVVYQIRADCIGEVLWPCICVQCHACIKLPKCEVEEKKREKISHKDGPSMVRIGEEGK